MISCIGGCQPPNKRQFADQPEAAVWSLYPRHYCEGAVSNCKGQDNIKTFLISAQKVTEKVKDQKKKKKKSACQTEALNTSSAQGFYTSHHQYSSMWNRAVFHHEIQWCCPLPHPACIDPQTLHCCIRAAPLTSLDQSHWQSSQLLSSTWHIHPFLKQTSLIYFASHFHILNI